MNKIATRRKIKFPHKFHKVKVMEIVQKLENDVKNLLFDVFFKFLKLVYFTKFQNRPRIANKWEFYKTILKFCNGFFKKHFPPFFVEFYKLNHFSPNSITKNFSRIFQQKHRNINWRDIFLLFYFMCVFVQYFLCLLCWIKWKT